MRLRNRSLPAEQKRMAAARIFTQVEALPAFERARCVACFCALPDEPPTEAVLRRWSVDRRVVVPRVEGDTMRFYDYRPDALTCGAFGIAEPVVSEVPEASDAFGLRGTHGAADPHGMFRTVVSMDPADALSASYCALCPPEAIDLLIVPGMAFTREGARLGRGKGYYDRYLAQSALHACCIGVCFAHQLVADLPVEPHDRSMEVVCFG